MFHEWIFNIVLHCESKLILLSFRNVSAPVKGRATNNVGEIQAAIRAIQDCEDVGVTLLQINTDSHFLCDAVKKCMPRWSQNGFLKADGSPLANQDEFMELDQLMSESNMHVVFKHVRAHNNDPYNDAADELAKAGAAKYRR